MNNDPVSESKATSPELPGNGNKNQYLLAVDDRLMAFISQIIPGILFIQVQGMKVDGYEDHHFMINPIKNPGPAAQENA